MVQVGVLGAFLGGTLSLLSPCSALLLPAFFAYSFQSRRQLLLHTTAFYFGLATLFVPLGLGIGLVARWVTVNRQTLIYIAGALLLALGVLEIFGLGALRWTGKLAAPKASAPLGNIFSTYSLGLVYGFAGVCSGPLLGAVLTFAAVAGSPWASSGLLLVYALGTAAPLFFLSALWERFDLAQHSWLRGRPLKLGSWQIHSTRLISGLLFISLGWLLLATGATATLESFYTSTGLLNLSFRLQSAIRRLESTAPLWTGPILLVFLGWLFYRWSTSKSLRRRP